MSLKDRITVSIKIKPFLKAYLLSIYGNEPIFFPKQDKFNDRIAFLLDKQPPDNTIKPASSDHLSVIIPYFEHINITSFNYMSENSQLVFENAVQSRFWVTYEDFMDECFKQDIQVSKAIVLFIEKYKLPYTTEIEDMLRKAIYRSRMLQRKHPRRKYNKKTKKNTSD